MLTICLVGLTKHPIYARQNEKKVLILNSYHANFTWTSNMVTSILDELNHSELDVIVYTEHMDWKNFPSEENIKQLYTIYKQKYKNEKFDSIITTDDKALEFALKHREELFSNAPIVFAGVNEEGEQQLIQDNHNITGIIEVMDLKETIAMALHINPDMKELYVIHDQTESGKSSYNIVENIIQSKYSDIKPISVTNKTHQGVRESIQWVEEDSSVLILTYYQDILGRPIGFEEFTQIISRESKVPVFHMYAMTMGHGNIGGAVLCAHDQGSGAGQLVVRILSGEKADEIPIIRDTPMKLVFDYEQLQKFDIPTRLIPEEAEIINEPFSFFKTYKQLVRLWLVIFFLLILFIIVLMIYIKEMQKIRNKLQASNEEITQGYEELTATDEELQRQLKEVNIIQNKLRDMAYLDALTQMPNKRALQEDLETYIYNCGDEKGAVIFIDADNFKLINDTLGHSIGDKFIIQIGKRLQQFTSRYIRVYRMGGDEFLVLITNAKSTKDIKRIADKIMLLFEDGFLIEDMMIHTTVSAGITIYPDHGDTSETLIMRADIAMYKAKAGGKGKYVFYNNIMNKEMIERASIEVNLRTGIENQEFLLHYQPQYDLKTKEIIGFEALIRWDSKELGWMSPFKFIKVAEDSRMIIPIGRWVLETACKFIKVIHELGFLDYTIAVNLSTLQVVQEDFVEMVIQILEENNLEPKHLELEMTETMLIENFQIIADKLEILRSLGIKVALDDFGTGYSSLNYLNRLPIDTLKIDKSFIDTISQAEEESITSVLIFLGHRMGLKVIAEGVETEQQFEYLRQYGCNHMQGYLLSRPLPEDEVLKLLRENSKV